MTGPSMLSLAASALYFVVIAACVSAAFVAASKRQRHWHLAVWVTLAGLFALLVMLRVFTIEELVRTSLRDWIRMQGLWVDRRSFQGIIIAIVLLLFPAAGLFGFYRLARRVRGRRNMAVLAAIAAGCMMILLLVLRLTSLHAMDRLLFGPLKLNWVGDIGASLAVILAAIFYAIIVSRPPSRRRERP